MAMTAHEAEDLVGRMHHERRTEESPVCLGDCVTSKASLAMSSRASAGELFSAVNSFSSACPPIEITP